MTPSAYAASIISNVVHRNPPHADTGESLRHFTSTRMSTVPLALATLYGSTRVGGVHVPA